MKSSRYPNKVTGGSLSISSGSVSSVHTHEYNDSSAQPSDIVSPLNLESCDLGITCRAAG